MTDEPQPVVEEDDDLLIDHEKFAGEEIKDPWDDDAQEDWPNAAPMVDADGDDD